MRFIAFYLLVLIITATGIAIAEDKSVPDGTIYGRVYDAETKQPVSGAWVYCQEAKCMPVAADTDGYYAIGNCFSPSKAYVIGCTKNGYAQVKNTAETDDNGKAELNFDLKLESQKSNMPNPLPEPESKTTQAISWERTFGGSGDDYGASIQQTRDGGYIIIGGSDLSEGSAGKLWLIKIDSQGNMQWNRKYKGSNYYYIGRSVRQTTDGDYIIAGSDSDGSDIRLIKIEANGNKLWEKTFGGLENDEGFSVQETSDKGYIILGYTLSYGAGNGDIWLIKTDANGNELWDRTFGGSGFELGYSIQQTTDDGYIVTGFTHSYGAGGSDIWLIRTDSQGNKLWDRTFGGPHEEMGNSVWQSSDSGYIISGFASSNSNKEHGWLIKTDANGNELWNRTLDGPEEIPLWYVQQTLDGGYILAGTNGFIGTNKKETLLIKTEDNGNVVWERTFGDTRCSSVQQTSDSGYIVVGTKNGDIWLKKTDSEGN